MPRRLRIEMPGGVYHVTNRGVDRCDIVRDDDDRREWFRLFHRVAVRCGWRVYAHVLMTNHFHIFLKTPEANLSSGMHDCQSGYATLFNKRHERAGALFQGRFNAVLVESEGHCGVLSRYLHLNPCRAGLTARPEAYRWSTYRFFLDAAGAPPWLDWRTVLGEFAHSEAAARIAYHRFVEAGLTEAPPNPLASAIEGVLLGGDDFVARHRYLLEDAAQHFRRDNVTIERVLASTALLFDVELVDIQRRGRHSNAARDAAIWLCRQETGASVNEIAAAFGSVSTSTVSDTVRRCEIRQEREPAFRELCEQLRGRVYDFSELADESVLNDVSLQSANSEKS